MPLNLMPFNENLFGSHCFFFLKFMPFSNYFPLDYDFQAGSFLTVQLF